jgi:hypothetical protein
MKEKNQEKWLHSTEGQAPKRGCSISEQESLSGYLIKTLPPI